MLAPMQRQPMLISSILRHAARQHPDGEIVGDGGQRHAGRTTYAAVERRARQLLAVLRRLGVLPGDRVVTLALPSSRLVELLYAAAGLGAIFHALDPGLPDDDLVALIDQGDDCVLFVDPAFADLAAALVPRVRHCVRRLVAICGEAELPMVYLPVSVSLHCYEPMLGAETPGDDWPSFAEDVPAIMSVTAGATGPRRAVLHSHRDIVLRALTANQPDGLGLCATDRVASCVEFHRACGWMLPFVAPMAGCALLLPRWPMSGAALAGLLAREQASCVAGPPQTLSALAQHLSAAAAPGAWPPADYDDAAWPVALPKLRRAVIGGGPASPDLLASLAGGGIEVRQGWGLTEAGALLTTTQPTAATRSFTGAAAGQRASFQGRALFGVELRLTDSEGQELPWDGLAAGELHVRGPAVAQSYRDGKPGADPAGWLPTGDIASIGPHGHVRILDRVSDLIHSGGAWIGGTTLEAAALTHPDVAAAACIAARHPKWTERPILLLAAHPGRTLDPDAVRTLLAQQVPRWSLPDAIVVLADLPRTPAGQVDKLALRRQYADYLSRQSTRA